VIQIKPAIDYREPCPHCGCALVPDQVLWQGIHICAVAHCPGCGAEIVGDLTVGAAIDFPYQVDRRKGLLFGSALPRAWLGKPFLTSLLNPEEDPGIRLEIEVRERHPKVVILNCIDYLYGHSLLKLLNAQRHLEKEAELGLILLLPRFLRWMVPAGVAELWLVDLPLSRAQSFRPRLHRLIQVECARFEEVHVSPAWSHPADFDVSRFTGVPRHDFKAARFRITFVWREDRTWSSGPRGSNLLHMFGGSRRLLLAWQNQKVRRLFALLRRKFPDALFTVAGLGRTTRFPEWIEDRRVARFDEEAERRSCQVYSESRLVIGVHGSNMLLPSGHAGLTIDLMPDDRWGNFGQDILYQEVDVRLASYRYRFLPVGSDSSAVARCAAGQLAGYDYFRKQILHGK
jgi:hypothetical protein